MWAWNVLKTSHFVRGMTAAFGVLTVVPQLVPLSALDLLGGMQYVIIYWNDFSGRIGAFFARLCHIPPVPHEVVTALAIAISIGPFWALSIYQSDQGKFEGVVQRSAFGYRVFSAFFMTLLASLFFVTSPVDTSLFWFSLIGIIIPLLGTLFFLPVYRAGFFTVIGFVLFMECVYLLGTPAVLEAFDSAVCASGTSVAPRCANYNTQ